jgi:Raf kinase inhibitor-like YbhB/YbcL family protein
MGMATLALFANCSAHAAEFFTLASTTFKDGELMPKKASNTKAFNANCDGENISPQLSWSGVPEGTKSFTLALVDPEGQRGIGLIHWVAYGIPANVTSLAEGEASRPSDKFVGGKNAFGIPTYSGPCPPPGSPHHYTFVMIATDLEPKALPPGLTLPELWELLKDHRKAVAGLVGLFVNPYPH